MKNIEITNVALLAKAYALYEIILKQVDRATL